VYNVDSAGQDVENRLGEHPDFQGGLVSEFPQWRGDGYGK